MHSIKFDSSRSKNALLCALVASCVITAADAQTVTNNGTGTNNGYFYSLFTSSGSSTVTFPLNAQFPGNYAITWSGVGDMVGGKGWRTGGNMSVGYNIGAARGYNTISVYGWTTNPLVEYYITEFGQLFTANATFKGTVSSDGHTYSTYEHLQVNQPSIVGTAASAASGRAAVGSAPTSAASRPSAAASQPTARDPTRACAYAAANRPSCNIDPAGYSVHG